MDDIDMECYIMPRVVPFLQHTIIQLRDEVGGAHRDSIPVIGGLINCGRGLDYYYYTIAKAIVRILNGSAHGSIKEFQFRDLIL